MEAQQNDLFLSGAANYIPQQDQDAFLVQSGVVLVYLVPWKEERAGRRLLLCEMPQGTVIPAFVYTDGDYRAWRFLFAAKDEARLTCLRHSATRVLWDRFCCRAGLTSAAQEGAANSLVEYYTAQMLRDSVFISRGQKAEPQIQSDSYGVIRDAFGSRQERVEGDSPLYRAVAHACARAAIPIASYDRVSACCGAEMTVEVIAQVSHAVCRSVVLAPDWYRGDCGVLVGTMEGKPVSCTRRAGRYELYDGESGKSTRLTNAMAQRIDPRAYSLGRALPGRSLEKRDLFRFARGSVSRPHLLWMLALGLACTAIGVLLPVLNQKIYDEYIPLGSSSQLVQLCAVIGSLMVGNLLFSVVKSLAACCVASRVGYELQNAAYDRVFHLPEQFFRRYDSADLARRLQSVGPLANRFAATVCEGCAGALFSLLYLIRMVRYSARLTWIALLMLAGYCALLCWITGRSMRYAEQIEQAEGEADARLYQILNGIEKIQMAGVEDRAALEYLKPFAEKQTGRIRKNRFDTAEGALSLVIDTLFSMALYVVLVKNGMGISMGAFVGFNTAFGAFTAAMLQLTRGGLSIREMRPVYRRFMPLFTTAPEDDEHGELPGRLSGRISVEHVSFSYGENSPTILKDLSLQIQPGEYVGIVGPSGCGKSTLLKLLLGFETPTAGRVYYDGKDIQALDKRMLRKNLGVVLQNGRLISGSIYDNITITAPHATMQQVQAVIEAVGLKEDIEQMPMGIHTILSENTGTISGGQQQRILIARAIISQPSILIFDEATSALDNVTQAAVCESLDRMHATRVVVAHRLSTIERCDRILVLDDGKIAEEGSFSALMRNHGLFYRLASRQIAD